MSSQRIINSRVPSLKNIFDEEHLNSKENNFIKSNLNLWVKDFQAGFLPPPPRPPFISSIEDLETDGLTSCDLCTWSSNEKIQHFNGPAESTNHFIILLIFVSFFSAALGGLITALKYRRSNSMRSFGIRGDTSKKQDVSTDQLCEESNRSNHELKKTAISLKYFMEENNLDNEIYATLDDQVSLNSDCDNTISYHRKNGFYNKSDNEIPSAPSSSAYSRSDYYSGSDFSGVNSGERQYESIDNKSQYSAYDKTQDVRHGSTFITFNNNIVTNRLSAITESQSGQMIRSDIDYVNSQYV